ncbi:MAG TPA: ATP-binding protein [Kiloniellales bacterium]|nr:ATP-binding protein [Kiloniellales bacterium]
MGRRVAVALLTMSAPVVLVLVGLVLGGRLTWVWALVAAVAVVAMLLPMLIKHFQHLETLLAYLDKLRRGGRAAIGMEQHWQLGSPFLTPQLGQALRETAREQERQQLRVESAVAANNAILSKLPDALLVLSTSRRIVFANGAAEELLGQELVGRELVGIIRHPDLLTAVDAALEGRIPPVVTFELPGMIVRHLSAHIAKIQMPTMEGTESVVVLALHDLTAIRRAEQLRADFVANASHELRTPLSSLLGFIETLLGPAKGDRQALDSFLPIMHEQAQRMARLVEDLLSLSRIELREHSLPNGRVTLEATVKTLAKAMALKAKERRIGIEIALDDCPAVAGDPDELAQVFQNLMDNALKYGKEGTVVRVEGRVVRPEEDMRARRLGRACLAVRVIDQGEGIEREHLARLTERFYRVDTARSRQLGGTGLGLAIVKHIINRHRGLLEIDSRRGEGSTFTVFLPLAAEAMQGSEVAAAS